MLRVMLHITFYVTCKLAKCSLQTVCGISEHNEIPSSMNSNRDQTLPKSQKINEEGALWILKINRLISSNTFYFMFVQINIDDK